jgi:hypothetical protein
VARIGIERKFSGCGFDPHISNSLDQNEYRNLGYFRNDSLYSFGFCRQNWVFEDVLWMLWRWLLLVVSSSIFDSKLMALVAIPWYFCSFVSFRPSYIGISFRWSLYESAIAFSFVITYSIIFCSKMCNKQLDWDIIRANSQLRQIWKNTGMLADSCSNHRPDVHIVKAF